MATAREPVDDGPRIDWDWGCNKSRQNLIPFNPADLDQRQKTKGRSSPCSQKTRPCQRIRELTEIIIPPRLSLYGMDKDFLTQFTNLKLE
jgi:hypothetical protein